MIFIVQGDVHKGGILQREYTVLGKSGRAACVQVCGLHTVWPMHEPGLHGQLIGTMSGRYLDIRIALASLCAVAVWVSTIMAVDGGCLDLESVCKIRLSGSERDMRVR